MMHIPRVSVASALVLAGVLAYAASAAAQKPSLNDIAKQESDRRKAVAAPAKVLTNGDLRPVATIGAAAGGPAATDQSAASPGGASSTAPAAGAQAVQAVGDTAETKDKAAEKTPEAQSESYWRGLIVMARATLDQHKTDLDGLQT